MYDAEDLEISPIHSRIVQVLSFVENQKVCSVSGSHSDALWQCLDCDRSLCDECLSSHSIFTKDHKVVSLSEMTKEDIEGMLKKEKPCQIHSNHDMKSYCRDCDKPICLICLTDYHKNHKITTLHEFLASKKDSLSKNLEEIESLKEDEEKKKQQEQIAFGIKRDGKQAQAKVKELTKNLVKAIIDQEQKLLNGIQKKTTKAEWNLRIIHHAPAAQEYIRYLIQNGTVSDMVDIQSQAECSKTFTYNAFEKHIAGMEFRPNEKLSDRVDTGLGLVRETFAKADPKRSVFQVKPNKLEAKKNAILAVVLNQGEPCDSSLDDVTIRFIPKDNVTVGEKQVTAFGHIKVTFTPRVAGQLTAEVQVHGNPVSNSPLVMDVKPQHIKEMAIYSKLQIALNIGSSNLSGIAVNKSNTKIAVADCAANCVRVFNMDGDLLLSYGSEGSGEGQLCGPEGLAFLNEKHLVIADSGNRRICIVDTTSGNSLKTFSYMTVNGQSGYPRAVHVDGDSNIIICDNGIVQVVTKDGCHICQFPVQSTFLCSLYAIKHNGLFYVSAREEVKVIEIKGNQSPTTLTLLTCIKTNAQLDGQVNIFKCPQCDSSTELKELNDVEDLEISPIHSRILQVLSFVENQKVCSVSASHSHALWQCLDCDRSLCDECLSSHSTFIKDHKVVALSEMTKEDIKAMLNKESPCKTHAHQDVELYCQDCDDLICLLCIRDCHKKHKITSLQEFAQDSLSKNFGEAQELFDDQEERQRQEKIALQIKETSSEAQKQVKELTKHVVKKLMDHEQELLNQIQKNVAKADRNLRIIRHAPAAQEYIKYFIQNGTASEIFDLRSDEEDSKTFAYRPFAKYRIGVEFKPNEGLDEQVNTGLGLVRETFVKADPNMCSFKVEPDEFEVMKKATLKVVLNQGEPCDSSLDDVAIRFTPKDDIGVGEKRATADGQIEVTFTPRFPGQLTAEVQVHGNPVSNSPLVMDVKPQHIKEMTTLTKLQIAMNTGSKRPSGIAVNKSNTRIAVADCALHCVKVFNMDGDLLLSYGSEGSGEGQLQNPQGLAFLHETNLVIADSDNNRICIVDIAFGKLLKTISRRPNRNDLPSFPNKVHVDDDSNIIVCGHAGNMVVLTSNGDFKCNVSVPDCKWPSCEITHNGLLNGGGRSHVQVSETKADYSSLTTLITLGRLPIDSRKYNCTSLAVDNDNNLLMRDNHSNQIRKFTLDGRYLGMSSPLNCYLQFIAVLNDGRIICTSNKAQVLFF
ncbi:E3 ubiquitin-protein ligase TRIM71 [Exaiptasia diaphana]|nr:E3 ubiquitin-protein ligase TRIM71 [Exaiptasia diaphana]